MRYFVLLIALVLSSCSHDDIQVNDGWVIYDLRPLDGECVMYYGEDGGFSIFNSNRFIKFVGYQGEYNIGDSIKIVKVK
jgi:hypothetical protein